MYDRVFWKVNFTVLHWVLYPSGKVRYPWVITPDMMSSTSDMFVFVENVQPAVPTEEVYWGASRKWRLKCLCLVIQDASRKVQGILQKPGPLAYIVNHTTEGVCGIFSQWYKYKS